MACFVTADHRLKNKKPAIFYLTSKQCIVTNIGKVGGGRFNKGRLSGPFGSRSFFSGARTLFGSFPAYYNIEHRFLL